MSGHYTSDSFLQHYTAAQATLENQALAIMSPINSALTFTTEMWNEPPWAGDPSDNGRDAYDSASLTVTQSGTTLTVVTANSATVSGVASTYSLHVGDCLTGSGFPTTDPNRDCVTALGSGTGGTGTYTMSQTVNVSTTTTVTTDPGFLYLQGNGPNYGMVDSAQNVVCAANAYRGWGGTDKSGTPDVFGGNMLLYSGDPFKQPTGCVNVEYVHPYGNNPEDAASNKAEIVAAPSAGPANNVIATSPSNAYQVIANTILQQNAHGSSYGINVSASETGTSIAAAGSTTVFTRFGIRQYLVYMVGGLKSVMFFKLFDLETGNFTISSIAAASGGSTVYTGTMPACAANACVGTYYTMQGSVSSANNGQFIATASTATTLTLANASGVADTRAGLSATYVTTPGFSWIRLLNSNGAPCTLNVDCTASTTVQVLPQFTALSGLISDAAAIGNAPVETVSAPTVGAYSGTYQFLHHLIVGSRPGAAHNSIMFVGYQGSSTLTANGTFLATTTSGSNTITVTSTTLPANLAIGNPISGPGIPTGTVTGISGTTVTMSGFATVSATNVTVNFNRWQDLPSPTAVPVAVSIPSGMSVTSVTDLVTRSPLPYSVAGGNVTANYADNPVSILFDPVAVTGGTVFSGPCQTSGGQVTITH